MALLLHVQGPTLLSACQIAFPSILGFDYSRLTRILLILLLRTAPSLVLAVDRRKTSIESGKMSYIPLQDMSSTSPTPMPVHIAAPVPVGMYQVPGTPYFVMDPRLIGGAETQQVIDNRSTEPLLKPTITLGGPESPNDLSASIDDKIWEVRHKRARLSLIVTASVLFVPLLVFGVLFALWKPRRIYDTADLLSLTNMTFMFLFNMMQLVLSISGGTQRKPYGLLRVVSLFLVLSTAACAILQYALSHNLPKTYVLTLAAVIESFFFTGLHWQRQVMEKDPSFVTSNSV